MSHILMVEQKLTVKTIESNFGIKIDRYAIVDFSGFKDIIDALGGLTIPITGNEARYINAQIEHNNQKCPKVAKKYCKQFTRKVRTVSIAMTETVIK